MTNELKIKEIHDGADIGNLNLVLGYIHSDQDEVREVAFEELAEMHDPIALDEIIAAYKSEIEPDAKAAALNAIVACSEEPRMDIIHPVLDDPESTDEMLEAAYRGIGSSDLANVMKLHNLMRHRRIIKEILSERKY